MEILKDTSYSRSAIRYTLVTIQVHDEGKSLLYSSTPVKYDSRSRRRILLNLRIHSKMTYDQRRKATGLKMSNSYIYFLAKSEGLSYWRAKKQPELIPKVAALRLL